jgi:hypothetical protein
VAKEDVQKLVKSYYDVVDENRANHPERRRSFSLPRTLEKLTNEKAAKAPGAVGIV